MVTTLGIALGALFTLAAVALHYTRGMEWRAREDIADEVLDRRAESVPETEFPEPMNRSIGGGGAVGAIGGGGGGAGGELAEGEAETEDDGPWALPDDEAETYEIEFEKEGDTIEVPENETILNAGEEEGWDLPYSCRQGQCISCSGRTADGPSEDFLVHDDQEMLGEEELGEGYALTCVAYPQSDMTIETGESP
jgi:2Fe-2S type ferredoxin